MTEQTHTRFTLRQLPLPAKLVVSVFLVSVGLGYFSALVQLHLRHGSRDGEPLPSASDVVEHFSGLKKAAAGGADPVSKIEYLIMGRTDGEMSKDTMAPAFFGKSGNKYATDCAKRGKDTVDKEREGERLLMRAWIRSDSMEKQKAYEANKFPIPADLSTQAVTEEFVEKDSKSFLIKDLIDSLWPMPSRRQPTEP